MGERSAVKAINKLSKIGKAAALQTAKQQCHYLHTVESSTGRNVNVFPSGSIMKRASFAARARTATAIYLDTIFNSSTHRHQAMTQDGTRV